VKTLWILGESHRQGRKKTLDKIIQMSRITRKSYRPRVSDRTMVDTPYNPLGLAQFQDRVAMSPSENRVTKMENKINKAVRGAQEPSVFRGRWGWKSSNFSQLPVEGKIFSLTFPFIEQRQRSKPRPHHLRAPPGAPLTPYGSSFRGKLLRTLPILMGCLGMRHPPPTPTCPAPRLTVSPTSAIEPAGDTK
jgi:hypothetical protein